MKIEFTSRPLAVYPMSRDLGFLCYLSFCLHVPFVCVCPVSAWPWHPLSTFCTCPFFFHLNVIWKEHLSMKDDTGLWKHDVAESFVNCNMCMSRCVWPQHQDSFPTMSSKTICIVNVIWNNMPMHWTEMSKWRWHFYCIVTSLTVIERITDFLSPFGL